MKDKTKDSIFDLVFSKDTQTRIIEINLELKSDEEIVEMIKLIVDQKHRRNDERE
jgi:hypothetical protein